MKYDKAYFIAKFEAIPDSLWCTGKLGDDDGRACALGHCEALGTLTGAMSTEGAALNGLFPMPAGVIFGKLPIAEINDGQHPRYQQPTPRARVLAALRDIP